MGVRRAEKLDRFGEQGYAVIYFTFFGSLGVASISHFTDSGLLIMTYRFIVCDVAVTDVVVPHRAFLAR